MEKEHSIPFLTAAFPLSSPVTQYHPSISIIDALRITTFSPKPRR